jgi:hypothetical protein
MHFVAVVGVATDLGVSHMSKTRLVNATSRHRGNGRQARGRQDVRDRRPCTHQVGNAEMGNFEVNALELPVVQNAELELLCVDSGTTHVVTPDACLLSNFQSFQSGQGSVSLAAKSSTCSELGCGAITLRSRSTGSDLIFHNALLVPNARRTLICLGRSMRDGVFWHFDRPDGGYVEVSGKGFWASMVLAANNLLFLDADPVIPPAATTSHMHSCHCSA